MKIDRRRFSVKAALGFPLALTPWKLPAFQQAIDKYHTLDAILSNPVLDQSPFKDPIIIERLELLRYRDNFICRVRSIEGAEGLSVSNNMQMIALYPIFIKRLQGFFIGKDARNIENLIEAAYVHQSNYKLQSVALWVPIATIEFAILDLLGKMVNKSIGALFGTIQHREISVYQANNYRGASAEESLRGIQENVESSGAKALKFKVGGRMSHNKDYPPNRSEQLIPLVRKTFGDDMVIYADSNGSYDVKEAIRMGKLMEDYGFDFFEEPVPFDWYEETKAVADAIEVPVAGGEQEPSMHQFRWLIANDALQIVQPDPFYFGGMLRAMKVARMAAASGKTCVPHISGSGLGFLYMMHFVSALPNAGPYHEFKGFNDELPFHCSSSSLTTKDGKITVPTGPGLGIEIDPGFVEKHLLIKDA